MTRLVAMQVHSGYSMIMTGERKRYRTVTINGAELRALRQERRLTQQELAMLAAPVTRGYVASIETGQRLRVSPELAARFAKAFDVDIQRLTSDSPSPRVDIAAHRGTRLADPAESASRRGTRFGSSIRPRPTRVALLIDALAQSEALNRLLSQLLEDELADGGRDDPSYDKTTEEGS